MLAWADDLNPEDVAITAMNEAEILRGLALLPDGRRKQQLQQRWEALAYGAPLATRNVADFEAIGLALINPWDCS